MVQGYYSVNEESLFVNINVKPFLSDLEGEIL